MSEHLRELLWLVGLGAVVGVAAGVALRKLRPDWCKRMTKFSNHKKWWVLLAGFLFFGLMAHSSWREGDVPSSAFFAMFSLVELVCFFWFGFRPLTPEMSKEIDDSDPTKFFWDR